MGRIFIGEVVSIDKNHTIEFNFSSQDKFESKFPTAQLLGEMTSSVLVDDIVLIVELNKTANTYGYIPLRGEEARIGLFVIEDGDAEKKSEAYIDFTDPQAIKIKLGNINISTIKNESITIESPNTKLAIDQSGAVINGSGTFTIKGTAIPSKMGVYNSIPLCPYVGMDHSGDTAVLRNS